MYKKCSRDILELCCHILFCIPVQAWSHQQLKTHFPGEMNSFQWNRRKESIHSQGWNKSVKCWTLRERRAGEPKMEGAIVVC